LDKPFAAYTGDEPYVFVCYAHDDDDVVYPEMGWIHRQGVNCWYDEGIPGGRIWLEEIGERIKGASHVLYYISTASLASDHCSREIHFALEHSKNIVPVYLEDIELTTDLQVALSRIQALQRDDSQRYQQQLVNALLLSKTIAAPIPSPINRQDERIHFNTLAVLPLDDLSAEQDLGSLAKAVTGQLVTRLDELPMLKVVVASGPDIPLILSGYLQRDGDDIEAALQIVRASDSGVLWSTTILHRDDDRALVSRFIVGELFRFVDSLSSYPYPGPDSFEAYRAWLNWHFLRANFRNWEEVEEIERAMRLEPTYALAHLEAFESYFFAAWDGQDRRWIKRAESALRSARDAGLEDSRAYRLNLGRYLVYLLGDLPQGEPLLREAGGIMYAHLLLDSGLTELGLKVAESRAAAKPNAGNSLFLGFARGMNNDLKGSLAAFESGLRRSPDHPYLLLQRARALIYLGDYDAADAALVRLDALGTIPAGGNLGLRDNQALLLGKRGEFSAALAGATELAAEGWHAVAGTLFIEIGDPRAAEEFELAAANVVAGRRFVTSWIWPDPSRVNHPLIKPYLESLGYTQEWRREISNRAIDFARKYGIEL
jgi:TolB-like protein